MKNTFTTTAFLLDSTSITSTPATGGAAITLYGTYTGGTAGNTSLVFELNGTEYSAVATLTPSGTPDTATGTVLDVSTAGAQV